MRIPLLGELSRGSAVPRIMHPTRVACTPSASARHSPGRSVTANSVACACEQIQSVSYLQITDRVSCLRRHEAGP